MLSLHLPRPGVHPPQIDICAPQADVHAPQPDVRAPHSVSLPPPAPVHIQTSPSSYHGLPQPVNTATTRDAPRFAKNGIQQSAAIPLLMALNGTLIAAFAKQTKAALLFFGAGILILAIHLLPKQDATRTRNLHPISQFFLGRMPEILTVASSILALLGVQIVFSNHVALVALVIFLLCTMLSVANIALWAVVAMRVVALLALIAFVVLVFIT